MRVYLDNCCYSRPYDPQFQQRVRLETEAKLFLQRLIRDGKIELVSSYLSLYECGRNSDDAASQMITKFIESNTRVYVSDKRMAQVEEAADKIMMTGVKFLDACHVAAAIIAKSEYFITVDKRLLKYKTDEIKMINPVDFFLDEELEKFNEFREN